MQHDDQQLAGEPMRRGALGGGKMESNAVAPYPLWNNAQTHRVSPAGLNSEEGRAGGGVVLCFADPEILSA